MFVFKNKFIAIISFIALSLSVPSFVLGMQDEGDSSGQRRLTVISPPSERTSPASTRSSPENGRTSETSSSSSGSGLLLSIPNNVSEQDDTFHLTPGKGSYGGIWSDTLNVSFHDAGLHTGAGGNVLDIDGAPFDIDQHHHLLMEHVKTAMDTSGAQKNIVVASITAIMPHGNNFQAYSMLLKDEEGKRVLSFVSGSVKEEYKRKGFRFVGPVDHSPTALLTTCQKRFDSLTCPMVQTHHQELVETCTQWGQVLRNQPGHDFGSAIDSEQYFLAHLQKNNRRCFRDVVEEYKARSFPTVMKTLSAILAVAEDEVLTDEALSSFQAVVDEYRRNSSTPRGFFINLHSTRELCCYCASSVAEESYRTQELLGSLAPENGPRPFVLTTVSASQVLTPERSRKRPGIGRDNRLSEKKYRRTEMATTALVTIPRVFLQCIIEMPKKERSKREKKR